MSLQTAIYSELSNASAITDLVGSDNIYAGRVPESAGKKYISYRKISNTHTGHLVGGSGLAQARVQVDCVAQKPNEADDIYDEVRKVMNNFQGTLGVDGSGNEIQVDSCRIENDQEDWTEPQDGSQGAPCTVAMDVMITYSESVVDNI